MAIQDTRTISAKRRIHRKSGRREGLNLKSSRLPTFLFSPVMLLGRSEVALARLCGFFSLVLALGTGCKSSAPTAEANPAGGPAAAASGSTARGPDELMSASTLLAAYGESAARADVMLKGKRVRVWGKATDVARGGAGVLSITLSADAKAEGPRVVCLFSEGSGEGAALAAGNDVTVDGTWTVPGPNATLKDCSVPHCAMPLCDALQARGVVDDCKSAVKDWSDSASFRVPAAVTPTGFGGGYVECEPNDKVYYLMVNDLRTHARPNQVVLASPKARVVVSIASDGPIPPDVETKTRALVEAL